MISPTASVVPAEGLGVLLPCGEHHLVAADVPGDRVFARADAVVVEEFGSDLGDRPVARTAAMTDPAEDIPADGPLGQGDGDFESRGSWSWRARGSRDRGSGRACRAARRAPGGYGTAAIAVVTDVHHPPAGRAVPIEDVEFPEGEVGLLGPVVGHRADLPGALRSVGRADQPRGYTCRSRDPSSVSGR